MIDKLNILRGNPFHDAIVNTVNPFRDTIVNRVCYSVTQ